MPPERKPRSDSKLKNLPDDQQDRLWSASLAGKSIAELVELAWQDFSVQTSETAMGEWVRWRRMQERMKARTSRVEQILEDLQRSGGLSADQIQAYGAALFMSEALEGGDSEAFVANARLHLQARELEARVNGFKATYEQKERQLALDQEKFKASIRSKLEAGLAALLDEIKGNAKAVAIFEQLKAEVREVAS